jgi:hypothetical protein
VLEFGQEFSYGHPTQRSDHSAVRETCHGRRAPGTYPRRLVPVPTATRCAPGIWA